MLILTKGIADSIQDLGRIGNAHIGINRGGAMDKFSLRVLNSLLQNPEDYAALEIHFPAPIIQFNESRCFALFGADFSPKLNNNDIFNGKVYAVKQGDVLSFGKKLSGERCYLGIQGKIESKPWLGSKSYQSAVYNLLQTNEQIKITTNQTKPLNKGIRPFKIRNTIRFVSDFEYHFLNDDSMSALKNEEFRISLASNRMGYRLEGTTIKMKTPKSMLSSATAPGTIQLLPNGQLIILMADAQTTGGYPKLGFVIDADMKHLSQLGPGKVVYFKKVSLEEAIRAKQEENDYLYKMKTSINFFANGH